MSEFHDKPFDEAKQSKLGLFRGYIREWLPVFLARSKRRPPSVKRVQVLDLFSGPGRDVAGTPGSPVITMEELKQFCVERGDLKADDVHVRMVFNDAKSEHIKQLELEVATTACPGPCCDVECSALPFRDALEQHLPSICSADTANLIIMDQCGVKEVTPDLVRELAECCMTDILFFMSSSFILRFINTPELGGKFDMPPEDLKNIEYNTIHRYVCDHYREKLGDIEYYLAPFSIKKGSNIYGVIFGSGCLRGLDKFLKVCWKADGVTGEANYNIDGDFAWGKQNLLPGLNVSKKTELFGKDLSQFLADGDRDNRDVYRFCLCHGFLPGDAKKILREMQQAGALAVTNIETGLYWFSLNRTIPSRQ